ncbi:GDP-L-galactose phosphorylase 2-like [Primulina tabacum]|uniref:GDP-L-galactose phosphorylase 2-like n=1 Tax=Primulina tabacum TaxID=48773 RepID=UPI003F59B463
MLTIKRVPTLVSNYQENALLEENKSVTLGCGRNCVGRCCLPVSKLPLYKFKSDEHAIVEEDNCEFCDGGVPQMSFLNNLLLGQWEDRMSRGLFRYDVTSCESKVIPGKYGFIAQLNEGRHLRKRPTEFCIDKVIQPFDESKFNFTKVGQEEVLFRFEPSNGNKSYYCDSASASSKESSPTVVTINVSPIEYGHVLLIPRVLDCMPQKIDPNSLLLALCLAREASDPSFRVGYNSLGAFATINHLHFQAYYLSVPFPLERALTRTIINGEGLNEDGVMVSELLDYPVRGFVFEAGCKLCALSDAIANCCFYLQNNNIPFNILISDFGHRVFLLPQCYAQKQARGEVSHELLDTQVNPAVWEMSGHIVLKRRKDFVEASEEYAWKLLSEVSLPDDQFLEVKEHIIKVTSLLSQEEQQEINFESTSPKVTSHLPQDCLVLY